MTVFSMNSKIQTARVGLESVLCIKAISSNYPKPDYMNTHNYQQCTDEVISLLSHHSGMSLMKLKYSIKGTLRIN